MGTVVHDAGQATGGEDGHAPHRGLRAGARWRRGAAPAQGQWADRTNSRRRRGGGARMKKPSPALLINANNTNTSFVLASEKRIIRTVRVPTAAIRDIPFGASEYRAVVLASVVPAATKKLLRLLPMRPLMVNAFINLGIG